MNISEIQSIIRDFESSSLMTLELEMENFKLKLSKNKNDHIQTKETIEKSLPMTPVIGAQGTEIKAPLVGTFYHADAPGKPPFVNVGDLVDKGDVLCIIEAMKIMNEIIAPMAGIVTEIMVKDGQAVGFDQVLLTLGDV